MANNAEAYNHEEKLQTIVHSNHHIRDTIQRNVNQFLKLREDLLNKSEVQQLPAYKDLLLPLIEGSCAEQLNVSIVSDKVQLALCGENSSGKTAFLHTFLDIGRILPSGDGPVTARITKLTYASADQARISIRKTLRDQTLIEDEVDLSPFFTDEKPKWMEIGRALSTHLRRPKDIAETSPEFAEWARCFVEIHIPSRTLALGIDVYDTPGFLLDDAPVLKEILRDLVELVHPTIVFMYANPSTDDATKGCFLALKSALHDLDSGIIFFLNSKVDINQMTKFKQKMKMEDFLAVLSTERAERYRLLLNAPFFANDRLEGLPTSIEECRCFDLCSVNSQLNKPYGPYMNETTIQHITQFVTNNDLVVATRICRLILPIINAFFRLILTSDRTPEQLLQLNYDAIKWEKTYFEAYTMHTEACLQALLSDITRRFNSEEEAIIQPFLNIRRSPVHLESTIQAAVRLQIITPAIRNTFKKLVQHMLEYIDSNDDPTPTALINEILNHALGRQELSDFATHLLSVHNIKRTITVSTLYMVNTISIPVLQCARVLQHLDFSHEIAKASSNNWHHSREQDAAHLVRRHLLIMQTIIAKQYDTMQQAVKLWGDQQKDILRSLIEIHYKTISPLVSSHRDTLKRLEHYTSDFLTIECKLRAAQDMAKFSGNKPEMRRGYCESTMFSVFIADWETEKNLVVKKLRQPLSDQPNAAFHEAHYHLKVANLRHPHMFNLRYLYEHRLDDQTSELWMIFPPIISTLEQFLQQDSAPITIKTTIKWMSEIADALAVLHRDELVHRNIALSNILITEDECAMLSDWGNGHEECDLSMRHNPSSTLHGTNDDMKGFGKIGLSLNTFIEPDEKIPAVIDEFHELMLKCSQASLEQPVTAEFAQRKLKFILDMF